MLVPPSPKFQLKEVGLPVLWLVNDTDNGASPEIGDGVKAATGVGGGGVVTVIVAEAVFDPPALVAVNVTV